MENNEKTGDERGNDRGSESEVELNADEKAFTSEYLSLAKSGILTKKGSITVRMFSLTGGLTMLAYTFSELDDSFIVGLPSIINEVNGGVVLSKLAIQVPMTRIYKHHIVMSMMPLPKYLLCYLMMSKSYLQYIKGYFNNERVAQIDGLIEALKLTVKQSANPQEIASIKNISHNPIKSEKIIDSIKNIFDSTDNFHEDYSFKAKKQKYRH